MNQFGDERLRKIARTKAFDRDKAFIQAMRLFWRKGYAATSIEDLTEALNLSRSSLYDTFGDKRTLFLAALRFYSERVISHMSETLNGSLPPLAAIRTLLDELAAGAGNETGAMGCFMVNSVAELVPYDPDVTELATRYSATIQELLGNALRQVNPERAEAWAVYLFNVIQGTRILIKSGTTREQMQSVIDLTMQTLK